MSLNIYSFTLNDNLVLFLVHSPSINVCFSSLKSCNWASFVVSPSSSLASQLSKLSVYVHMHVDLGEILSLSNCHLDFLKLVPRGGVTVQYLSVCLESSRPGFILLHSIWPLELPGLIPECKSRSNFWKGTGVV